MINTTPITHFIQALMATELVPQRELKIPIQQARLLGLALAEILDKMNQDYESMFNELKQHVQPEVVSVAMDGGGFDNK